MKTQKKAIAKAKIELLESILKAIEEQENEESGIYYIHGMCESMLKFAKEEENENEYNI